MFCITEIKYVTLGGRKIFLAKHLLFLLLCKNLSFLNEGHQTHITCRNVKQDLTGEGYFYSKLSTDLTFLKPWASQNRAPSFLMQVVSWLRGLLTGSSLRSVRTSAVRLGQAPPSSPCVGQRQFGITSPMCKGPCGPRTSGRPPDPSGTAPAHPSQLKNERVIGRRSITPTATPRSVRNELSQSWMLQQPNTRDPREAALVQARKLDSPPAHP